MHPFIEFWGITIPTYGICCVIGLALAMLLLLYTHKKRGLSRQDAYYCAIFAIIGGFIGAKLMFLIVELPTIIENPSFLKSAILGGFVFYGGLIGGAAGGAIYCRKYKLNMLEVTDAYAAPLTLAQAIGRVGCFFAGCCYGMESDSPLAITFPGNGLTPGNVSLLPTQLFESAFLLILTAVLLLILKKNKKPGIVTAWYFILYSAWRFFIEFYRNDPRGSVGALSTSQFISLILFPIGVAMLIWIYSKKKDKPAPESDNDKTTEEK